MPAHRVLGYKNRAGVKSARRDTFAQTEIFERRLFCTLSLLHERSILHEDTFAQVANFFLSLKLLFSFTITVTYNPYPWLVTFIIIDFFVYHFYFFTTFVTPNPWSVFQLFFNLVCFIHNYYFFSITITPNPYPWSFVLKFFFLLSYKYVTRAKLTLGAKMSFRAYLTRPHKTICLFRNKFTIY